MTIFVLKLFYPCHPQVWPTWVARVTTMSHLLTVLSSSVSFLLTVHSLSVGFWKQSWFGELTMGRWTSTSTHWSTREACSACCFQVSLQRTGEARLLSSSRFENIYAQRILPALKKVFQFWRTLQNPVPGSNTQRISPALILILILCFNFGEVSSPIWDGKAFIPAILLTLLQKVFKSPVQLQIHKPRYCDTKWRLCNHRIGRSVSFL